MKRQEFLVSMILLILITVILFAVHLFVVSGYPNVYFYYPVWSIYAFHFVVTALIFGILSWIGRSFPEFVGYAFMATIVFKMAAALIFLLPLIQMDDFSKVPDFISFFAPYFIYLLIEIVLAMKIINPPTRYY